MNPLSQAMKMVRLATKEIARQGTTNKPPQPSEPMQIVGSSTPIASDETGSNDREVAGQASRNKPHQPSEPMQIVRSSTPIASNEARQDDSTLYDISFSKLVVFKDVDNVLTRVC
ncbi:hypothetical protein PoB_005590500 [Plakobranchus ocellatus]|uniref:Uncharacterized protein n=1 Tax=Plakobranchus ocellatus TaxID=259542 RepID=A0AAV4CD96_9GAST|nr:hypothetical protein PoB_005590500 [Plakobranchus ocellatus]